MGTDPLAWFSGEQDNLIAAVTEAHHQGLWQLCWELADRLSVRFEHHVQWSAWEHASRHFDEALVIFTALGDQRGTAYARLETGVTHRYHGRARGFRARPDTVPRDRRRTRRSRRAAQHRDHARRQGRYQQAIDSLTRALAVFQRDRVDLAAARSLRHLGVIYRDCGRLDDALAYTQQGSRRAVAVFHKIGGRIGAADSCSGSATPHAALGLAEEAMACFDQSLPVHQELQPQHQHGDRRAVMDRSMAAPTPLGFHFFPFAGTCRDRGRLSAVHRVLE